MIQPGCKMVQTTIQVIKPNVPRQYVRPLAASTSFKRFQIISKWYSFRIRSFLFSFPPRLVPGQPPPDLRAQKHSKPSVHHAMPFWVGSTNLKKTRTVQRHRTHASYASRNICSVLALGVPLTTNSQRLFVVFHVPATPHYKPLPSYVRTFHTHNITNVVQYII